MSLLCSNHTFNCQSEKKEESAYHIQYMYYTILVLEFLHKMLFGSILKLKALTSEFANSKIYCSSSLEDDSITCGEMSDESSLDSLSECSCANMTRVEEERNCEIYFAAITIQNICSKWIKKVKAGKRIEIELVASQTVTNAFRIWLLKMKVKKERDAVATIQSNWRRSLKMKVKKERDAVATIQSNWRIYHGKQCRAKAIEEEKAELVRNMTYSMLVIVFPMLFHLLLHTYFWQ